MFVGCWLERERRAFDLQTLERIDRCCEEFEAAWKRGTAPTLEEAVSAAGERERRLLLAELIVLDVEYRRRSGTAVCCRDYLARFADARSWLPVLLADRREGGSGLRCAGGSLDRTTAWAPPRIGDYTLGNELGRGGMGIVYEAAHAALARKFALKILRPDAITSPLRRARFEREARAVAALYHPSIVSLHEFGERDGVLFCAMQYVEGESLACVIDHLRELRRGARTGGETRACGEATLSDRRLSQIAARLDADAELAGRSPPQGVRGRARGATGSYYAAVARLGLEAAEALAYAHGRGVLHRDIKPGNLLIDITGKLWIADFGLARIADDETLTESGELLGTLPYLAPERLDGWSDARSDVYGLGVTLYELATLHRPFETRDHHVLLRQISRERPCAPHRFAPDIPRGLETVIRRAIERDPSARYASAGELAIDLRRVLDGRPPLAGRRRLVLRVRTLLRREPTATAIAPGR